MECGMDTIPGGKLESVGNLIDLPLDLERTNVAGTQLLAGQAESYVPGGQSHPVPRVVEGSGSVLDIRKVLVSSHCPLEVGSESPTLSRSFGTSGLQLEPPMALPSTGRARVGSPWEKMAPAMLILLAECSEVPSEFLYLPLSLAVCLGIVTGGQAHCDS